MKYGLTADDCKLANSIATAKLTSERLYLEDYNKNVKGLSAKADVTGYPVYKESKELKAIVNDAAYTAGAKKNMLKNHYAQTDEELRAREVALYCNPDRYAQQRRQVINDYKGFMRMDAALHPVVQRGILVAELQSDALYREDYELEKDLIYFPAQITPGYEAAQAANKFQSDIEYRKAYNEGKTKPNKFNHCDTENYKSNKVVEAARSDKLYHAKHNEEKEKGKGFTSVPVTMEMDRIKVLNQTAINVYKKEAKDLAMKYGLDAQDQTMANLISVQKLRSDLNYKKKYLEEDLGKSSVADITGYPHLAASKKLQREMTIAEYGKEARKDMSKNNYAKFQEQERAEKMAYDVRGSNYKRQFAEVVDKYKGFQRMDAASHPIVAEGNRVNDIISQQKYIEDYLMDRNVIYYPVHMTPGYEAARFADKWQSNIDYHKDHKETGYKNKFIMSDTERYADIKNHENYRSDKKYKAKQMAEFSAGKGMTSIEETPEMVISKTLKPLRCEYQKEAKNLAAKYGLCHGAMQIAHAMEVAEVTNHALYTKKYRTEVQGTTAKNPAIAYPLYDLYADCQKQRSDIHYQKNKKKTLEKYSFVDSDECRRARKTALSCTPREYKKQRAEVIEKYKGFQRMDAATHPIVLEGERVNNLISRARYLEDFLIDKESIYFPVHVTPGYETAVNANKLVSDSLYKEKAKAEAMKNKFITTQTEKYQADKVADKFRSDKHYTADVKKMFSEGKGFTEVADRFDVNLSKSLIPTRGERYSREAKEICGKYGLTYDSMAVTSAIAIGETISQGLYKKKYNAEVKGTGAKNPAIAHPEYLHYRDVQATLNKSNYVAEHEKTGHTYTIVESDEVLRARKVALQCTDKEYSKQRQEVINKYKGFQHMDAHLHPVVAEGERVNDIISKAKYIEDYLMERNFIYFPAHITPGYETAVAVNKFQSDLPYRKDYLQNRHKNQFNATETERYKDIKESKKYKMDQKYSEEWNTKGKLTFTSEANTPIIRQAIENSKNIRLSTYHEEAKKIMSKYGLELENHNLQTVMEGGKHHKDYLYKAKYNAETKGKGATYTGIQDVFDYARAKQVQYNLNDTNYKKTGEEFNHKFTPVYDTPVQVQALVNQKNINQTLYSQSKRDAINKYKGFQRMDAATHPIVIEGERVNDIISKHKYIEDYLIDRNMIYYPVHLTPGFETAMYANKWQSDIPYHEDHHKNKWRHQFNVSTSEKYIEDKARRAAIGDNAYTKEWQKKLASGKQHTEIKDPTEVKLAASIKPWIGSAAYTKAAKDIAAKHGLVAGDISLQHAAETKLMLSMKDYRKVWSDTVRGTGGCYKSIDDMYVEKQCKINQTQLSQKNYKAKDLDTLHKYTPVIDTPDMQRVANQKGLLNDYAYAASRRECIAKYKGFQTMDAHSHPVVQRGVEASERISNARYTEDWNEAKEMIYFPVQITPAYESAMKAYQHQSNLLYTADYRKNKKSNNYNMCDSELYANYQEANKSRSDYSYQKDYRENRGKGFTEVITMKEKTALDIQPLQSMRWYQSAAHDLMGKYHIDCSAMQVGHAMEMQKAASDKVYHESYDKDVKGFPSRFFHLTETYAMHKRNADGKDMQAYAKDSKKVQSEHKGRDDTIALKHAQNVMKLMSGKEYYKTKAQVDKTFKGFSKLTVQDDMNCVRAMDNQRQLSEWRYKEDYLEERQYAYFPVHITPGYENALKHTELMSDRNYQKSFLESRQKSNSFKPNETEHYIKTKDLTQNILPAFKYQGKYLADRAKGFIGAKGLDVLQETLKAAQASLNDWNYRIDARRAMGKYNVDIDLPVYKLARENKQNCSESIYRKAGKESNTKYTSAGKDEFILQMHNDNKKLTHPKQYTQKHEEQKSSYTLVPDNVINKLAADVSKMQSKREYFRGYSDAVKTASAYKNIDFWPSDRLNIDNSRAMSRHIYQEDYLIERECCFYPVHITPGYELALEVNKFQSAWLYNQKYKKDVRGKPNRFRQTETEKYIKDEELKNFADDTKYRKAGKKQNENWQFTVITPVNEHQKAMKELGSKSLYEREARKTMMVYDLPVQRIDLVAASEARKLVSDYLYLAKHREEKGQSRLWNAADAADSQRHKDNQLIISEKLYKEASKTQGSSFHLPADAVVFKAAKEAGSLTSDITYKKSYEQAIKQCRAFSKLSTNDLFEYERHRYIHDTMSDRKYKEEYYDQLGWCIPEFDTPEARRIKENYERGDTSDKLYKKDYNKNILGKGLTDFTGPQFQHAKAMKDEQSKIVYEAAFKDKTKWSSHMANQGPGDIERKRAQELVSDKNYKDLESYQGIGAAVMSEETRNMLVAQHMASANEYKKEYNETKHKSEFDKVADAIDSVGFREAQKLQSDNEYKKKHLKEDIGKPSEMAMSVKLLQDRENQKLASELPYKRKGERTKHQQSYQNNLYLTPWAEYMSEMKNLMSHVKYTQEWDDEKTDVWVPYMWTQEYEHFKAQTKEKSMIEYTKDHKKERNKFSFTTDTPFFHHTKESSENCSNINYGNRKNGKLLPSAMAYTTVPDTPVILRVQEAQKLANNAQYREEADLFNHFCAQDPTGYSFVPGQHIKDVNETVHDSVVAKPDKAYPHKPTMVAIEDYASLRNAMEMQALRSDKWYKAESLAEMHAVNGCSVVDTPWHLTAEEAQQYQSQRNYKTHPSKLKKLDDGSAEAARVKEVQDLISDIKYREDYNDSWKGQVLSLPIPFDLNMEAACERQKIIDNAAYKKDAKERMQQYVVVPDNPYFRKMKELCELSGERTYKAAAFEEMRACNLNSVDALRNHQVKQAEAIKSERNYREAAKAEMSQNSQATTFEIEAQTAATKISDKINYRKEGKAIQATNLQAAETLQNSHARDVAKLADERNYKAQAKIEMQATNCNTISSDMISKQEAQKLTDERGYRAQAQAEMQTVNMNVSDSVFMKNAKEVAQNASDLVYKKSDQFGGIEDNEWCFQYPDALNITTAQKINEYQSEAAYKKAFNENKGKLASFVVADTPEYKRLQEMQEQYSDLRYREDMKKKMADITFTPNLKEAARATEQASEVKYRLKGKEEIKVNSQTTDAVTAHQMNIDRETMRAKRDYAQNNNGEFTVTDVKDDLKAANLTRAQKIASRFEYQQKNDLNEFSKIDKLIDQERHDDNTYLVSNAYKQKIEGKSLDMTPSLEAKMEFQHMASKLEYGKNHQQNENKFTADKTPMFKQLKDLKPIQSDVQYKKKAKEGMDRHKAEGLDNRVDIDHSTGVTKNISDVEYKKAGKEQTGFTFVPEAPIHDHHKHAGQINSELRYKRDGLASQKGKGWQAEENNPFQNTYTDAQKFTSGRNYKTQAKEIMTKSCFEDDPAIDRVRNGQKILSDREYRKDFEKKMKGRGYDLHCTPFMASIKKANAIKSDKEYKKDFEGLKGKSAGDIMDSPAMKAAKAAQALMKGVGDGQLTDIPDMIATNDKWVTARVSAILDTPEMRRINEAKKNSMRNYKEAARAGKIPVDTPEMQRIKNASKIQSKSGYADGKWKGKSCAIIDTPEMRMVKRNQKNYSDLKYKADLSAQKGKRIQVADDVNTKRAKKANEIASDLAYKGIRGKVDAAEAQRTILETQEKQERIRNRGPQQAQGFKVGRNMQRYRADPGSIFDLDDPTDVEFGTHRDENTGKC